MSFLVVFYIIFLVVFLLISGLIFRHTIKYKYLSPRFSYVVGIFAIISLIVIGFSVYLILSVNSSSSSTAPNNSSTNSGNLDF